MAIAIKSIPVLREKEAKAFIKKIDVTTSKRASVNFSKQVQAADAILKKASMR